MRLLSSAMRFCAAQRCASLAWTVPNDLKIVICSILDAGSWVVESWSSSNGGPSGPYHPLGMGSPGRMEDAEDTDMVGAVGSSAGDSSGVRQLRGSKLASSIWKHWLSGVGDSSGWLKGCWSLECWTLEAGGNVLVGRGGAFHPSIFHSP